MENILHKFGFHQVGEIAWQFPLKLFWHQDERVQVSVIDLSPFFFLKGTKSYRLRSITPEGQQFSRDLPGLQSWLESHSPEVHISVSCFRDITPSMIFRKMGFTNLDYDAEKRLSDTQKLMKLAEGDQFIGNYLKGEFEQQKKKVEKISATKRLAREYDKKAVSVAYVFSYSSNLQVVRKEGFADALASVVKDVRDAHHYEIRQKLQGGKLQIFVEEVTQPDLAFQIEWAGGMLNPKQLEKLGPEFDGLRKKVEEYLMVFPTSDIEGAEEKKLFGAKAIQVFLSKLERMPQHTDDVPDNLPEQGLWLGNII